MTTVHRLFFESLCEIAKKNNNAADPNFVEISTLIAQVNDTIDTV